MGRNCSKNILLLVLSLLFVALVSAAVYLLITAQQKIIKLDKYTELQNLCDTSTQDENYIISCPALLLNISTSEDKVSCFGVQIITKNNTLETTSICQPNDEFQYSNDILNYKKLLPIEITFSYKPTESENTYQLDNIMLSLLNEEYIQQVVNQDIQSLIKIDPASTTIQNSIDFCPAPNLLPNYITEEIKDGYSQYYDQNKLSNEQYKAIFDQEFQTQFIENWADPTIKIFFGCDSSTRLGYSDICNKDLPEIYQELPLINIPSFVPDWKVWTNTNDDLINLKNISLIYDGILYSEEHFYYSSTHIINELFQIQNDKPGNQNGLCYESKLYQLLKKYSIEAKQGVSAISTLLDLNLASISPLCTENLDNTIYDKNGIYLKSFYSTINETTFTIYQKCNNLYLLLNE